MAKNLIPSFTERIGNLTDKLSDTFAGAGIAPGRLFENDSPAEAGEEESVKFTHEEERAWGVRNRIIKTKEAVKNFLTSLQAVKTKEDAVKKVNDAGLALFKEAVSKIRTDWEWKDNNLYWTRLIYRCLIKKSKNKIVSKNADDLIATLEEYSRGRATVDFGSTGISVKKVLISGFEPFQVAEGQELSRGNPSGLLALSLHGTEIELEGGGKAKIQSVIWSNRYEDFNSNMIENFYTPYFSSTDLIITFSLDDGSNNKIDIERFAANYRGGWGDNNFDPRKDNENEYARRRKGRTIQREAPYYETTLPYKEMVIPNKKSGNFLVYLREDYTVILKSRGLQLPFKYENDNPVKLNAELDINKVAEMTEGSGGDYFSNEIFFRVARTRPADEFPYGHIHVPKVDSDKYPEYVNVISKLIKDAF